MGLKLLKAEGSMFGFFISSCNTACLKIIGKINCLRSTNDHLINRPSFSSDFFDTFCENDIKAACGGLHVGYD